jgi:site-specific DNA recombinase
VFPLSAKGRRESDRPEPISIARCRELLGEEAESMKGYEVLERFHEEGESAKSTDRSQLQNVLTYCWLNKGRVHFVVVFNLTRFARDKYGR